MADRHAFLAEDAVVIIDPLPGLARIDERKCQRADAVARRHLDGLAIGAGNPQRRVRLLHRLRQHVAAGHFEKLALEAGIGVHHHHVGALLDGLVHIRRFSTASKPTLKPPSSIKDALSPVPNSTRPLETRSSVAMRSATRAG